MVVTNHIQIQQLPIPRMLMSQQLILYGIKFVDLACLYVSILPMFNAEFDFFELRF
ncbi:MAG TPA: hypothetical protein VE076_13425 [Nitrososphaeraceae archaeon]|nr:hypothetical protein [Nitrososphaeraceae archaeon]